MSNIEARSMLDSITGYVTQAGGTSQGRPVRLGTIDPNYTSGLPSVIFDGEAVTTLKGYTWVEGYTPVANDRVYLVPVGQSYIIAGKLKSTLTYNQFITLNLLNGWQNFDPSYYQSARVTRTPTGLVHVSGLIKSGNVTAGVTIAQLPEPFRPTLKSSFLINSSGSAAGVDVYPNGNIVVGAGWVAGANYTTLDNITFNNDPQLTWNVVSSFQNGWTHNSVALQAAYAKDSMGRVWHRGAVSNTVTPAGDTVIYNVPAGYRAKLQHHLPSYSASTFGNLDAGDTGDIRYKYNGGGVGYEYLNGVMYHEASVGTWTNASMLNGWVANSTGQNEPSYYKDSEGIVYLRGLMRSGTVGAMAFVLPAGYRPGKTIIRAAISNNSLGRLDIQSDGAVVPVSGSGSWFSLDGIQFSPEQ